MNFDEIIDRRGTHSDKWDMMEAKYGVSPGDGIAMWVADMDFAAPEAVTHQHRKDKTAKAAHTNHEEQSS